MRKQIAVHTVPFLTVAQAAAESGVTMLTIRRHIAKGALPVVRWGPTGRIRIKRSVFEAVYERLSQKES